jgi:hypothetical protein
LNIFSKNPKNPELSFEGGSTTGGVGRGGVKAETVPGDGDFSGTVPA